jgi:hypothetical protein
MLVEICAYCLYTSYDICTVKLILFTVGISDRTSQTRILIVTVGQEVGHLRKINAPHEMHKPFERFDGPESQINVLRGRYTTAVILEEAIIML